MTTKSKRNQLNKPDVDKLPFVLASSSPRRRELLASLGISFTVIKPDIEEDQRPGENPLDYVQRLSVEKAMDVLAKLPDMSVVLAADTIVIYENAILGKPQNPDEARDMLRRLRGDQHRVCTSLTLMSEGIALTRHACTDVYMRDYTDTEIEAYIATGDPFDKAGGYAIQHAEFTPVARIEGSHSNVVGLPLETLREALLEIGWTIPSNEQA
jgi:MAF protein